jgi:hypothetical protein
VIKNTSSIVWFPIGSILINEVEFAAKGFIETGAEVLVTGTARVPDIEADGEFSFEMHPATVIETIRRKMQIP